MSFEGSLFEPNGINLSGVAGYEMFTLYQAAQYYEMALNRFYSLLEYMWASISEPTFRVKMTKTGNAISPGSGPTTINDEDFPANDEGPGHSRQLSWFSFIRPNIFPADFCPQTALPNL